MCSETPSRTVHGGELDTIAQLTQVYTSTEETQLLEKLQRRAASKFLTRAYAAQLAGLVSPLRASYWRTWWCCDGAYLTTDGKIFAEYCKNRWCLVCNRIRAGEQYLKYQPVVSRWPDAQFVTLTVPNCPSDELADSVHEMGQSFRRILKAHRTRKLSPKGIRKLEVTYSHGRNDYHPHYHCLVDSWRTAKHLVDEWLYQHPTATNAAQDISKARSLAELLKYLNKPFSKTANGLVVEPKSLDTIFRATYRKRIIQPFGFKMPAEESSTCDLQTFQIEDYYIWDQRIGDWISHDTGEALSGWRPSEKLLSKYQISLS